MPTELNSIRFDANHCNATACLPRPPGWSPPTPDLAAAANQASPPPQALFPPQQTHDRITQPPSHPPLTSTLCPGPLRSDSQRRDTALPGWSRRFTAAKSAAIRPTARFPKMQHNSPRCTWWRPGLYCVSSDSANIQRKLSSCEYPGNTCVPLPKAACPYIPQPDFPSK